MRASSTGGNPTVGVAVSTLLGPVSVNLTALGIASDESEESALGVLRVVRIVRLLRLLKLARVLKQSRLFKRLEMQMEVISRTQSYSSRTQSYSVILSRTQFRDADGGTPQVVRSGLVAMEPMA